MSLGEHLLLGNEATAWGAIDSGISGVFSYPGTPATEIFETIQRDAPEVWAHWSANEKVAYEEALGMSYAGKRCLVSMKHVGLNVASDPFMSSALTGVNAGLVLVVGDDPGMHSSQDEQDSRFYSEFAKVPMLEPSTQQEAYDMTREAFEISERFKLPVMVRLVTRLAHSRSNVLRSPSFNPADREPLAKPSPDDWTLVPSNARRKYRKLLEMQPTIEAELESSNWNHILLKGNRGVVCSGTGYNYVREALGQNSDWSILRIGAYPIPKSLVRQIVDHCSEILVVEESYPFLESRLVGILGIPGKTIRGRLDNSLPLDGELTPERVAAALGLAQRQPYGPDPIVSPRPPQLCKGCPHADSFGALVDATADYPEAILFSDIGCYTLGVMAPYRAVHSCVDMGASISMAHGAARAGAYPVLCTIGDSTFTHSGITSLIGAARTDADITVIILDNATTAMTGTQESMATGDELIEILKGLGVTDLHVFEPLRKHHSENVDLLRRAIEHRGLSVIVARRACIHLKATHKPIAATVPVCQATVTA